VPRPARPPALHREDGDEHGDQHQGAHRVGEVGGDVALVAGVLPADGGDDRDCAQGGHAQGGDDAVEPDGRRPPPGERVPPEEEDADVGDGIEGQEEGVLHRRVRHRVHELEIGRPHQVAGGEEAQGHGEGGPARPLAIAHQGGPEGGEGGTAQVSQVPHPSVVEGDGGGVLPEDGREQVEQDQAGGDQVQDADGGRHAGPQEERRLARGAHGGGVGPGRQPPPAGPHSTAVSVGVHVTRFRTFARGMPAVLAGTQVHGTTSHSDRPGVTGPRGIRAGSRGSAAG